MLKRLKAQGISILVSTSYMDEASLCDRIGLILNGKMLQIDSTENIIRSYPDKLYGVRTSEHMHKLLSDLRAYEGTEQCYTFGEYLHITLKTSREDAINYLQRKGYNQIEFKEMTPTVEDSFIRLLKTDERNSNKNEQAN